MVSRVTCVRGSPGAGGGGGGGGEVSVTDGAAAAAAAPAVGRSGERGCGRRLPRAAGGSADPPPARSHLRRPGAPAGRRLDPGRGPPAPASPLPLFPPPPRPAPA